MKIYFSPLMRSPQIWEEWLKLFNSFAFQVRHAARSTGYAAGERAVPAGRLVAGDLARGDRGGRAVRLLAVHSRPPSCELNVVWLGGFHIGRPH